MTNSVASGEDDEQDDELFEHYRLTADAGQHLVRLDKFVFDRLPNVTRTKVQNGINQELVKVNGEPAKPSYKVHPGDVITVSFHKPPRDTEVVPENIPLNIVFEDDALMIIDKPAGMVVHPAHQNWTGTLVNALAYHFKDLPTSEGNAGRPGLVHRIDKDTSGLLVVAKTELALTHLAKQFFHHTIERKYWAVVWGVPDPAGGTIDVNLGRSPKDRRVTIAFPDASTGRRAVTHYKVLDDMRYVSMLECSLETGRTHQIRAHLAWLGHPLFGDAMYGGKEIRKGTVFSKYRQFVENCFKIMPRQALHARTLGFTHPTTGRALHFESPLPADFVQLKEKWDHYVRHH